MWSGGGIIPHQAQNNALHQTQNKATINQLFKLCSVYSIYSRKYNAPSIHRTRNKFILYMDFFKLYTSESVIYYMLIMSICNRKCNAIFIHFPRERYIAQITTQYIFIAVSIGVLLALLFALC